MSTLVPISQPQDFFPTIFDLRATHTSLLTRQRQGATVGDIEPEVRDFVKRAQRTGALLDVEEQRDAAQGLIDYWVTTLYRASIEVADDPTLVDFDPALAPTLDDALCPYVGLNSFHESDSSRFYGRRQAVHVALDKLRQHRFLAVLGPSGSGKSSIVLGGVLPALKANAIEGSAQWRYLPSMVPGSEPMKNLAAAYGGAKPQKSQTTVITIDQFEELFTLTDDLSSRQAFVDELLSYSRDGHVLIVTMRSDYDSRLATTGELQTLFEAGDLRATPLTAAELREAIEEPAKLIGLKFESGVVDALVRDVLGEPAALPLLQFTLWKLWQTREHNRITLAAYRKLGGGRAALANAATALYESFIQQDRDTMRRIVLRMVRPAAGAEVTSSRALLSDLLQIGDDPERVKRVVERLAENRLVRITGEQQVEVAHEALIRNWPLLVSWVEHKKAEMLELQRFESLADEWARFGRESGFLDEEQLKEAEHWLRSDAAKDLVISDALLQLVDASRSLIRRARWMKRVGQTFATALAIALIVVLYGAWMIQKKNNAQLLERAAVEKKLNNELRDQALADARHQKELAEANKRAEQNAWASVDQMTALIRETEEAREAAEKANADLQKKIKELENARQIADPYLSVYEPPAAARPVTWAAPPEPANNGPGVRRRVRPVTPGVSVGGGGATGSSCCVVQDAAGTRYLLTLPFVVGGEKGARVFQPGPGDGGTVRDVIGIVERVGSDAYQSGALIRLAKGTTLDAKVPRIGALRGVQTSVRVGEEVRLVGRGSALANGRVIELRKDGQILTSIIPDSGDAGGPVVNARNELIGMLVSSDNKSLSIVVPIAPVMQELGVRVSP
ncbi:MAG TPA: hypothetical protein VHW00_10420 [Thermoanaerobaculia bacterium]|nr:hypothetical protein [Thermoanaerobaculia bacterium]